MLVRQSGDPVRFAVSKQQRPGFTGSRPKNGSGRPAKAQNGRGLGSVRARGAKGKRGQQGTVCARSVRARRCGGSVPAHLLWRGT